MVEREKVIRGLECWLNDDTDCPDDDCPYMGPLICDQTAILNDAITILKAQDFHETNAVECADPDRVRVVRCSDCRFWEPENAEEGDSFGRCRNDYAPCQNQQTDMNWYCADGEKVEG